MATYSSEIGPDMTSVSVGDTIDTDPHADMRTNVALLLGTPTTGSTSTGTYGYNQGGTAAGEVTAGSIIEGGNSSDERALQDDIQALAAFLGVTPTGSAGADIATGQTITAEKMNSLMQTLSNCISNRLYPASVTTTTDSSSSGNYNFSNTLSYFTATHDFSSRNDMEAFFNGGGQLGLSMSMTPDVANAQNLEWQSKFSNLGDVFISAFGASSGAGSLAPNVYYKTMSDDTWTTLTTYYGGSNPYQNDFIRVEVYKDTSAHRVIFRVLLSDADDNLIDAPFDGSVTVNARRKHPDANGSGFVFAVPVATTAVP